MNKDSFLPYSGNTGQATIIFSALIPGCQSKLIAPIKNQSHTVVFDYGKGMY